MANTTGGMLGAMLAALIIIPTWGVEKAFLLCALIFGLMALIFLDKSMFGQKRSAAIASIALTFVLIVWIFPFGIMKAKYLNYTNEYFLKDGGRRVVIKESLTETIQLFQKDIFGKPHYYRLITNSHSMAATTAWCQRYMKLYVYFPAALMEHPKNALLICYGTGMTAKALTDTRHFDHIDIVDTSKDIFELSKIIIPG